MDGYLTADECDMVIALMETRLGRSEITRPHPDKEFRTSSTCDLRFFDDSTVNEINWRIARAMGIHLAYSEFMERQYYRVGQQFQPHEVLDVWFEHELKPRLRGRAFEVRFTDDAV